MSPRDPSPTPTARPVNDGVVTLDGDGRVAALDGAAERLLGYPGEEVRGRCLAEACLPEFEREEFRRRLGRLGRTPTDRAASERFESRVVRADHSTVPVEVTMLTVPSGGAALRVVFLRNLRSSDGLAMPSAEAWEDEVAFSSEIQRTFLRGRVPEGVHGLEVAALSLPCRGMEGDFYDFVRHGERHLDVVIGDVMGKGISAALLGSAARAEVLRSWGTGTGGRPEPEAIVAAAHGAMTGRLLDMGSFVTLCYARFDLDVRRVSFVDAGHPRTLHWRAGRGTMASLQGGNLPIGVREDEVYRQHTVPYAEGDVFVFYSDGVTDPPGAEGEALGEEGLQEILQATAHASAAGVVGAIREAIESRRPPGGLRDDVTCVVVKATPVPAAVDPGATPEDALHEDAGLDTFEPRDDGDRKRRRPRTSRRKGMVKG